MSNIVERLRALANARPNGHVGCAELWIEAADEIERLREKLARYAYPPEHRVSVAEAERDEAVRLLQAAYDGRTDPPWGPEARAFLAEMEDKP